MNRWICGLREILSCCSAVLWFSSTVTHQAKEITQVLHNFVRPSSSHCELHTPAEETAPDHITIMAGSQQQDLRQIYHHIIDDVVAKMKPGFLQESVDE